MHATFRDHQEEIDAAIAEHKAEREKLAEASFPIVRSLSGCIVCHRPKNPGLLVCWPCFGDMDADKISAEHILELVADAELKNQGDWRGE